MIKTDSNLDAAPLVPVADADAPETTPSVQSDSPASLPRRLLFGSLRWAAKPSAPFWVGGLILAIAAGVAGPRYIPGMSPGMVVFDPVKFLNAQRAAASILAMRPNPDLAFSLTQVAKQAESVIQEEAHGAVVLVRQAVVTPGNMVDITDRVLTRFGLSTDVPTISMSPVSESVSDIAPTDAAFSQGQLREDYRIELQGRADRLKTEISKKVDQLEVLP